MPLLWPIYEIDGQPYLDGGIGDSIPWRRGLEKCDRVIVVLTRPRSYRRRPERMMKLIRKRYRDYPKFVAAMEHRAEVYNRDRAAM